MLWLSPFRRPHSAAHGEQVSRGPVFRKDAGPLYFLKAGDQQQQSRVWNVVRSKKSEYRSQSQDAVSVLDNTPPSTGEVEDRDKSPWSLCV